MVTAAELLQAGLKYDQNMAKLTLVEDYLREQNYQITPIINGNKLLTSRSLTLHGDCKVFYMDIDIKSPPTKHDFHTTWGEFTEDWVKTPVHAKVEILHKLGRNLKINESLLVMFENYYRFVSQEEVSNYDLPIVMEFIESHFEMWSDADTDLKFIVFEENKASFHFLALSVCKALAQSSRVVVIAMHTSAPLAYLFVSLCLESGVPKNTIQLYIVDKAQLENSSTIFFEGILFGTLYEEPNEVKSDFCGCSIVVTESADLHSALDSLISGVTFSNCYPWAVSSVFIQESVYAKFQAIAQTKLSKAVISDSSTFVIPSGSKHLRFPGVNGPIFVFGDSRIVDMGAVVTVQPYRTTKELLSLIKYPKRFALSVWCDSVSVANEISIGADLSTVWINMYGVFDLSPQTKVMERHAGMIQQLGAEKILYERDISMDNDCEEIKKEIIAAVLNLKGKQAKWMKSSRRERASKILQNLRNVPKDHLSAEEIQDLSELMDKLNSEYRIENSDVRIINGKMNIRLVKPVGTVMIQDILQTNVLTDAVISVVEGNSILYIADVRPALSDEVLDHLSNATEIPVVTFEPDGTKCHERVEVCYTTKMFDAIIRNGYQKLYKVKNIWSPIGESFAN